MSRDDRPIPVTYTTVVERAEDSTATGLRVPAEAVAALGRGKKPAVIVSVGGHTYRSTVAAYGDLFMLPLSKANREAAGVRAGDQVEVTLELDLAPRTVEIPADLASALADQPGSANAFTALSFTRRKEAVRSVEGAVAPETRRRRIQRIVAGLAGGGDR